MNGNQSVTREFADDPALVAWLHGMDMETIDDEDEKPHARKLRYSNEIVMPEPGEVTVIKPDGTQITRPMNHAEYEAWQKSERADAERTSDDIG